MLPSSLPNDSSFSINVPPERQGVVRTENCNTSVNGIFQIDGHHSNNSTNGHSLSLQFSNGSELKESVISDTLNSTSQISNERKQQQPQLSVSFSLQTNGKVSPRAKTCIFFSQGNCRNGT